MVLCFPEELLPLVYAKYFTAHVLPGILCVGDRERNARGIWVGWHTGGQNMRKHLQDIRDSDDESAFLCRTQNAEVDGYLEREYVYAVLKESSPSDTREWHDFCTTVHSDALELIYEDMCLL